LRGIKVGDSESEAFWAEFIANFKKRGLTEGQATGRSGLDARGPAL